MVGLPPGGQYFLSKRKKVPKKARGTATPEAARPASRASVCGSPAGCPRPRGVRCRRSPCRSLCSPPTLPAGRFGLRPRPHWGHASLRDSSLRSPAGKKASTAHFDGGARNVARNEVGQLSHTLMRARARLFPPPKWAGLFPSAAYRRSASPQLALGRLKCRCLGCFDGAWVV